MSVELKVIIYSLIFMLLLNISLGFIISPDMLQNYNQDEQREEIINSFTSELTGFSGWFVGGAVNTALVFGSFLFSLFGIDFILMVSILPPFIFTILTFLNTLTLFVTIMYIIDRFWIG